jgi:hypothetical protein
MIRITVLMLLAGFVPAVVAADVSGVKIDETARVGNVELVLNGAGLRRMSVFRVYVAGLYLAEKQASAAAVLALAGPKRFTMRLMRDLSARQLIDALEEGLRDNTPAAQHEGLKARAAELAATMNEVNSAKEGDVIALDYVPDVGTRVLFNGVERGKPIAGADFYRALLRIWLGDNPPSTELKRTLLGHGS